MPRRAGLAVSLALAVAVPACGGPDRRSGGGGGGGGGTPGGDGGDAGEAEDQAPIELPDLSACAAAPLAAGTVTVDTAGNANLFGARCNEDGGLGGADAVFVFAAPAAGRWRFSTQGSGFDTVLSLRTPSCDAGASEVLRCNDDVGGGMTWSRIAAELDRGEVVLVVVDAFEAAAGSGGAVTLAVAGIEGRCEDGLDNDGDGGVDCDDADCAATPACLGIACPVVAVAPDLEPGGEAVTGSTGAGGEALSPGSALGDASCGDGGGGAPEAAFGFTAPRAGRYVFSAEGSGYDTLLYARDGACTGPELACDEGGGGGGASSIVLDLAEGQGIVLVVDGSGSGSGPFRLAVAGVETACGDGVDDDGDGAVDCDDDDCLSVECAIGGAWPAEWAAYEDAVLVLSNERRAEGARCAQDVFGPAPPVEADDFLRLAARLHSLDMGARGFFDHTNPDGLSPFDRTKAAGFRGAGPEGENIAAGQATPADVVAAWMNSPGHCTNIMNPDFGVLGVGYAFGPDGGFGHLWTQNFGGSH